MTIMLTPPFKLKLPAIAESEQTPIVRRPRQIIAEQQEPIQRLEDDARRLKGAAASSIEAEHVGTGGPQGGTAETSVEGDAPYRRGPRRAKTTELTIYTAEQVLLAGLPAGSRCKGYRRHVVPHLENRIHNTGYLLEQWPFPSGECVTAPVPPAGRDGHYGPQWVSYLWP